MKPTLPIVAGAIAAALLIYHFATGGTLPADNASRVGMAVMLSPFILFLAYRQHQWLTRRRAVKAWRGGNQYINRSGQAGKAGGV